MEDNEKQQLITRLNIVIQQRNSFLDQIVLLQEQVESMTKEIENLKKQKSEIAEPENQ